MELVSPIFERRGSKKSILDWVKAGCKFKPRVQARNLLEVKGKAPSWKFDHYKGQGLLLTYILSSFPTIHTHTHIYIYI